MQFLYEAKDKEGGLVSGTVDAYTEDLAIEALNEKGMTLLSLTVAKKGVFNIDVGAFFTKPNNSDVVVFTRQLATIISADIPLIEGLQTIGAQSDKKGFSIIIAEMTETVRGGSSLSKAMALYPSLFSSFYISLVRSGEISGRLEGSLVYLADYLEKSQALNSKIRGALAYPVFILCALGAVTLVMMTSVLPKLLDIIKESGVAPEDIPPITRALMAITGFFNSYIVFIVAGLLGLGIFLRQYIRTEVGHYKLDRAKINVPRLGVVARNIYIARISETLATLIKAGVPILDGIKITSEIAGNDVYRDILLEAQKSVQNGGSISDVISKYKEFPKLVSSMLAIGEKTGKTDFMLESIFKFYNFEAEKDIQNMSQLIEPVLILLLGAGVGLLVAGILLPIFSLVGAS
ncbi:MAG: type II secretion system F family protein [bacterium]|nr:type II secretion system F family protein [bacterium]